MSKDRNIDDAELAKIDGAGGLVAERGNQGDTVEEISKTPPGSGGGGVTSPENDAEGTGTQEEGPV